MAIEGTKMFEYRCYGVVPPNIPAAMIEGAVMSSVAWVGSMVPHLRAATVIVHDTMPKEIAGLVGAKIVT
jgi:hypothetical protein